jgi:two-component system, response regulator PdtaR
MNEEPADLFAPASMRWLVTVCRSGSQEGGSGAGVQRRRILIVEDDFFAGLHNQDALESAGYDIVGIATHRGEALALALKEAPDLIIMDIRLARGDDGIDLAIELWNSYGIPSVFASAHSDPATRARAASASPLGWITKPFTQSDLVRVVEDAVRKL